MVVLKSSALMRAPVPILLYPEETVSSWLGRAAHYYGYHAVADFLRYSHLEWTDRSGDIDQHLDQALLERLTHYLGEEIERVKAALLADRWVIVAKYRNSMCPVCWLDDVTNGRQPYWRKRWASVLHMVCSYHKAPLMTVARTDCSQKFVKRTLEKFVYSLLDYLPLFEPYDKTLMDFERYIMQAYPKGASYHFRRHFDHGLALLHEGLVLWDYPVIGQLRFRKKLRFYALEQCSGAACDIYLGRPLDPDSKWHYKNAEWRKLSSYLDIGYRRQQLFIFLEALAAWQNGGRQSLEELLPGCRPYLTNYFSGEGALLVKQLGPVAQTIVPSGWRVGAPMLECRLGLGVGSECGSDA
jgi:hypothetical protein